VILKQIKQSVTGFGGEQVVKWQKKAVENMKIHQQYCHSANDKSWVIQTKRSACRIHQGFPLDVSKTSAAALCLVGAVWL